jgi:hypothetical protein
MNSSSFSPVRRAAGRWSVIFLLALPAVLTVAAETPAAAATRRTTMLSGEEVVVLGFETLSSFPYKIVDQGTGATKEEIEQARKQNQIPASIQSYSGTKVALTGYMLPLKMVAGLAQKFVLMKDVNTCCYGATPSLNDYVIVTMKGAGIKVTQDVPVVVIGTLQIAEKYDGGYVVSLYELEGTKFLGEKK